MRTVRISMRVAAEILVLFAADEKYRGITRYPDEDISFFVKPDQEVLLAPGGCKLWWKPVGPEMGDAFIHDYSSDGYYLDQLLPEEDKALIAEAV